MGQKLIAVLRIAMIALFMSHYASATLFTHTHHSKWGSVTHSHPYAPSAGHSHSAAGFHLIDALSSIFFIASAALVLAVAMRSTKLLFTYRQVHKPSLSFRLCPLRAPPAFC